jgi:hypothetical protein
MKMHSELTLWSSVDEKLPVAELFKNIQYFMECEGPLLCSEQPAMVLNQINPVHNTPSSFTRVYNKWVPYHYVMVRPQVADGGADLQIRRVTANILNKQSRIADKWWPSNFGIGHGVNHSST